MSERNYKLDFDQVRASANGRWAQIYGATPGFEDALKSAGKNRHVECPVCKRKRFRLFKDYEDTGGGICTCNDYPDGFMLLRAFWNYGPTDTYELFKRVAETLGGEHSSLPPAAERPKPAPRKLDQRALSALQLVHGQLLPISHPSAGPMRAYLTLRGIDPRDCPSDLLFHPALDYAEQQEDGSYKDLGKHPAMVAIVRTVRGAIVTLHRTYLTNDGKKAALSEAKKLMPKAVPYSRSISSKVSRPASRCGRSQLSRPGSRSPPTICLHSRGRPVSRVSSSGWISIAAARETVSLRSWPTGS